MNLTSVQRAFWETFRAYQHSQTRRWRASASGHRCSRVRLIHDFGPLVSVNVTDRCCFRDRPRLYALIIGINNYDHQKKLRGAVPDADAIRDYLVNELKVPEGQIVNLRNSEASRTAIIDGFNKLRDHPDIKVDDPILIYYAGHGGTLPAPPGWESGSGAKIQTIVPQDYNPTEGEEVYPIPDRTIGGLIDGIANKKGNNIVSGDSNILVFLLQLFIYRLLSLIAATLVQAPETTKQKKKSDSPAEPISRFQESLLTLQFRFLMNSTYPSGRKIQLLVESEYRPASLIRAYGRIFFSLRVVRMNLLRRRRVVDVSPVFSLRCSRALAQNS